MKFAFLIMGENFNSDEDRAEIGSETAQIIGVTDINNACDVACKLLNSGIDCIELCGAFGEEGAEKIICATENKIPVGFVTHLSVQNDLYRKVFGK